MAKDHPLKNFRENRKPPMSRAELANLLGVKRATVHRWENGDRQIDRTKVAQVAEATGIAPRELRPDLIDLAKLIGGLK